MGRPVHDEIEGRSIELAFGPAPELQVLWGQLQRVESLHRGGANAAAAKEIHLAWGELTAAGHRLKAGALVLQQALLPSDQLVLLQGEGPAAAAAAGRGSTKEFALPSHALGRAGEFWASAALAKADLANELLHYGGG